MNRPHFRFLSGVVMVVTVLAMGVPKPARGGRLIVTNVPLKFLIAVTFAMADPQSLINSRILGGPDWIDSERYDISARANTEFQVSPDGPSSEMLLMIHSLLQERFKLVAHRETRELPIYELVVARADGRLGPGLHKSDVDCVALTAARQAGAMVGSRIRVDFIPSM